MDNHEHGRRRFLQQLGISLGGIGMVSPEYALARSVLRNLFISSEAKAADLESPRNYVNIYMMGGPSRLCFDQWMKTEASEPSLIHNDLMANSYTYNATTRQVTGMVHKTFSHNGFLVPHLFSLLSSTERASLLDQFLIIRGYGSGQDGHPFNAALQMHPLASAPSMSGLLADSSARKIEAVQYPGRGTSSRFKSEKSVGLNIVNAGGSTALEALLAPAVVTSGSARIVRNTYADLFTQFRSMLATTPDDRKSTQIARKSLSNAYQLFSGAVSDYAGFWTATKPLYEAALWGGFRNTSSLAGINATDDGTQSLTCLPKNDVKFAIADNLSVFNLNTASNMFLINQQMIISSLAEGLTMAEYLIRNELSSSIELAAGAPTQLTKDTASAYNLSNNSFTFNRDAHSQGAYPVVYILSMYYLGITKGLLLFKERLQSAGKWDQTIVHLVSDFGRTNRADASGSDHGFNSMSSSVFSGVFQGGPYVVGNVSVQPPSGFAGSQGLGLPISGYTEPGIPSPKAMASTLSALMEVPKNPWLNFAPPLVKLNGNGLQYTFGKGKLIA